MSGLSPLLFLFLVAPPVRGSLASQQILLHSLNSECRATPVPLAAPTVRRPPRCQPSLRWWPPRTRTLPRPRQPTPLPRTAATEMACIWNVCRFWNQHTDPVHSPFWFFFTQRMFWRSKFHPIIETLSPGFSTHHFASSIRYHFASSIRLSRRCGLGWGSVFAPPAAA